MTKPTLLIVLFCNAVLGGLLLADPLGLNLFLQVLLVNVTLYVVPGMGWMGLLRRHVSTGVAYVFYQFVLSIVLVIGLHLAFLITGHVPGPRSFLVGLLVLTNAGIILTRPGRAWSWLRPNICKLIILGVAMLCVYSCIFAGMKTLPGQLDLDGEHQGTAYGLVHEFKPYLTSDIMASPFYFAHPTLSNIFNAYSTLLLGRLDDYRYFYDGAKTTQQILDLVPGQDMPLQIDKDRGTLLYLQGKHYVFTTMRGNDLSDRPYSRQRVIEHLSMQDQNRFFEHPRPFPARASNIFASLLVLYVLFQLITKLTNSRLLGIVGAFVYIFSPGIFIRSCFSEHVAFTNALLAILAYQFCFPRDFEGEGRWGALLKYLPGVIAGMINQKIVILVFPLLVWQAWTCFREKKSGSLITRLIQSAPIPVGFGAGVAVFWLYALLVDPAAFVLSHLRVHLFDRLFHLNTMFAGDYPSVRQLWVEFNYEFPPFLLAVFALLYGLKDHRNRQLTFFTIWILSGAIVFSVVDWKQTNHLTQLTIPLLTILMIYIEHQRTNYKRCLKILVGLSLLFGFWFDMQLLQSFQFYEPTSGW